MMLSPILGSESCERVLIFILARNQGYATEIAKFFGKSLYAIQKQLDKLEKGGVLVSHTAGRTRIYRYNPRYPFLNELRNLLKKALTFYPADMQEKLLMNRRRPRQRDKPI
ncbi:winged helix-turn-helix domain-containing protein [Chloroflexota bacterium]